MKKGQHESGTNHQSSQEGPQKDETENADEATNPTGTCISKTIGRIVVWGIFAYCIVMVIIAAGNFDEKLGISTTINYKERRLMPSFSVCVNNKKGRVGHNGTEVERELNKTK